MSPASEPLVDRVVADFQARSLPALTPREVRLPSLSGKVDAVAGMRRSGKTYLLRGNPLKDIAATRNGRLVMQSGRLYELSELLRALEGRIRPTAEPNLTRGASTLAGATAAGRFQRRSAQFGLRRL